MPQQFDILENRDAKSRAAYPYLIVLQHNRADTVATMVAAPLAPLNIQLSASRLHPSVAVNGQRYVIFVEQLAAISRKAAGPVVGSAKTNQYEITAALDMLFTGI